MRDTDARFKLRGALLTIHDRFPGGFTSKQLAEYASVNEETTRDFLKSRNNEYAVVVSTTSQARGRPSYRYSVSPSGRAALLSRNDDADLVNDELLRPAYSLRVSVDHLKKLRDADYSRAISLIDIEMAACRSRSKELREKWPTVAPRFDELLNDATKSLEKLRSVREAQITSETIEGLSAPTISVSDARRTLAKALSALTDESAERIRKVMSDKILQLGNVESEQELRRWQGLVKELCDAVIKRRPAVRDSFSRMATAANNVIRDRIGSIVAARMGVLEPIPVHGTVVYSGTLVITMLGKSERSSQFQPTGGARRVETNRQQGKIKPQTRGQLKAALGTHPHLFDMKYPLLEKDENDHDRRN